MNIYGLYSKYTNVRNAAWKTLIDFNINKLPVSVTDICRNAGISLIKNSAANLLRDGESGISIKQNEKWYVVYDDHDSRQRIRFTVAHELGHILMGHALKYGYYTRKNNIVKPADETSADMFAARLLAPTCVLWGIGAKTAEQIACVCDISMSAAVYRAERLDLLRKRDKFLSSPLERQVYAQFTNYMQNNRL